MRLDRSVRARPVLTLDPLAPCWPPAGSPLLAPESTAASRYILARKQAHVTHMPSGTVEGLQMFTGLTFDRGELLRVSGVSGELLRQRARRSLVDALHFSTSDFND